MASDTASSVDVVLDALDFFSSIGELFDYVILLEPTSPLTEASDIDKALRRLADARAYATSLVGIQKLETAHPAFMITLAEDGLISPASGNSFDTLPRRQDLLPIQP